MKFRNRRVILVSTNATSERLPYRKDVIIFYNTHMISASWFLGGYCSFNALLCCFQCWSYGVRIKFLIPESDFDLAESIGVRVVVQRGCHKIQRRPNHHLLLVTSTRIVTKLMSKDDTLACQAIHVHVGSYPLLRKFTITRQ
jgi:hypothetical protein